MAAGIPKRRADGGSFRDPAGRVYLVAAEDGGSRVVRGLDRMAAAAMRRLLAEPFFRRAMDSGRVARTALLDAADPAARSVAEDGWAAAVEHEAVEFVSYPYEWSFSMLKDAALLQLSLVDEAARSGWLPKDATPFNVQWRGARPVFIDAPSFEPWRDGEYWRGYRQFCAMFLAPLLLTAHLGAPFQPLLRSALEGLPPEEAARYFYGRRVFARGVLPHVLFPAWAERRARRRRRPPSRPRRQPKVLLFSLVDGLTRLVRGLSWRAPDSDWARYAERHSYGAEMTEKARFVDRHVSARRPRLIWDLGANTGVFSRISARSARTVVAVDSDLGAVERLYARARSGDGRNVLPLAMDIANPSPAQGWAGRERAAFDARGHPDMVLCLALVHHLRVSANVPLDRFLDWLRGLNATVVLEYVGRRDDMFAKLVERRTEDYADYDAGNFEREVRRRFRVRDRLALKGGARELLLLEPGESR